MQGRHAECHGRKRPWGTQESGDRSSKWRRRKKLTTDRELGARREGMQGRLRGARVVAERSHGETIRRRTEEVL